MAVDPENPLNVAASFINIRSKACGLMLSTDGGGSWRQTDASPGMPSYPFCFSNTSKAAQTAVAFGRNHRLYYLLTGWDTQTADSARAT